MAVTRCATAREPRACVAAVAAGAVHKQMAPCAAWWRAFLALLLAGTQLTSQAPAAHAQTRAGCNAGQLAALCTSASTSVGCGLWCEFSSAPTRRRDVCVFDRTGASTGCCSSTYAAQGSGDCADGTSTLMDCPAGAVSNASVAGSLPAHQATSDNATSCATRPSSRLSASAPALPSTQSPGTMPPGGFPAAFTWRRHAGLYCSASLASAYLAYAALRASFASVLIKLPSAHNGYTPRLRALPSSFNQRWYVTTLRPQARFRL